MIRQKRRSMNCRLLLLYILGLNIRVGSADEVRCQLSILIPFHDDRIIAADNVNTVISIEDTHRDGLMLLATALLAIHDFNNRESSLAPRALDGIQDSCKVQFSPPKITDSRQSATLIRDTVSSWRPSQFNMCSFVVGPTNNIVADVVGQSFFHNSTIAISYGADANRLAEDAFLYPNLALANVKWEDYARSLMQYVKSSGRNNVGVLLTPGDNLDFDDNDFLPMWTRASKESGVTIKSLSLIAYRSRSILEERLLTLRDERGIKTILVTMHRDDELELLAEVADSLGMLTKEYRWIMTEHFLSSRYVASYSGVRTDSPVYKLFRRAEIFEMLDGFSPYADESSSQLLQSEILVNSTMLAESIQSIASQTEGIQGLVVNQTSLEEAFFSNTPVTGASRLYDAILASGLSACNGDVSMGNFLQTEFDGVSGKFAYPTTESRSLPVSEFQFGVFTILSTDTVDCPRCLTGTATFEPNLIHRTTGGIKPEVEELQTLSLGVRMYGFILSSLAMLFSFCCAVFVYKFRKDRIVTIGQPEFLGLVCIGSFLVAIPIILMSFDEASGWNAYYLSISCTIQIWLKYLGILIVNMALFSKLYRVEKVTQMRRRQRILVKDVMKPFFGLFVAAFVVLIIWTAVERPVWKREFGIGSCYEAVYFGVSMDLIMMVAISLTLWWGHKTRDLPEDISDAKRVYFTLIAQFILLMFDVLFSIFTRAIESNTFAYVLDATYAAALSFTCCAYLIVPKAYYVYIKSKTGEMPPSLQRGTVRVTGIDVPTGAAGISGNARYQSARSNALRTSHNNNFTSSSAASGVFSTQESFVGSRSSVEKSGFMSAEERKEISEGAPEPPLGSPAPRRSTPPSANTYSTPLPTVLDSSMRSSGLGLDSETGLDTSSLNIASIGRDSEDVRSHSVTSENVWIQSVEESKQSPEESPFSSDDLRFEANQKDPENKESC